MKTFTAEENLMEPEWDKKMTKTLVGHGLTWEEARTVVGIIAEQRQLADRRGYIRGYNKGHDNARLTYAPTFEIEGN